MREFKELNDIKDYLEKNLKCPASTPIVITVIEKLLKKNVKYIEYSPEVCFCPSCKKWITNEDINTVETFKQTLEEPSEYQDFCKCGGTGEDFESMQLGAGELVEILNKAEFRL